MNDARRQLVLYVDDDESNRQLVIRLFERYRVRDDLVTASTVEEALHKLQTTTPDLIILDLDLPDGTGSKVLDEVKATRSIPVVILTGQADHATRSRLMDAGADAFFAKPFDVQTLLDTVRSLIG